MNPYEPPTTASDYFGGFLWTIRIGVATPQVVCVSGSLLKGIRTYVTDADGNRGPVHRGPVDLEVGQQEVHSVRIQVDETGMVTAHVDGMMVDPNLFPKLQHRIQKIVWAFVFFVAMGAMGAMLWALFYFLKM
jgi:hypothetical protein